MITHLCQRPDHAQVLAEALIHSGGDVQPEQRWRPFADLLQAARAARARPPIPAVRTAALVLGCAIDAVVAENLRDPEYDTDEATMVLSGWLHSLLNQLTATATDDRVRRGLAAR